MVKAKTLIILDTWLGIIPINFPQMNTLLTNLYSLRENIGWSGRLPFGDCGQTSHEDYSDLLHLRRPPAAEDGPRGCTRDPIDGLSNWGISQHLQRREVRNNMLTKLFHKMTFPVIVLLIAIVVWRFAPKVLSAVPSPVWNWFIKFVSLLLGILIGIFIHYLIYRFTLPSKPFV